MRNVKNSSGVKEDFHRSWQSNWNFYNKNKIINMYLENSVFKC